MGVSHISAGSAFRNTGATSEKISLLIATIMEGWSGKQISIHVELSTLPFLRDERHTRKFLSGEPQALQMLLDSNSHNVLPFNTQ